MVTSVPVDNTYEFPRSELAAMSDNIAWLIKDIDKLDGHRRNMMEELKVLHDITLFYNEWHPELHATVRPATEKEDKDEEPERQHGNTATEQHASTLAEPEKRDAETKKQN